MKLLLLYFIALFVTGLMLPQSINASSHLPTISIVNMIRGNALGHKNQNLLPRLKAQWNSTTTRNIRATWLWQYDALRNNKLTEYAKQNIKNQEFGLFLEIDRNYAQESNVSYRGRGVWYFSDGLFPVSYDVSERFLLIDRAFNRFKSIFGYYPKTVGAWWIDSLTLNYMQQKYRITSSVRAADQYNLDVYSIWGTPWSISYLPSKTNAGIPANSYYESSKVVITQWASRDPVAGYGNSNENGINSYQDYETKNYTSNYFNHLSSIFLKKPLDHVIIGLENDGDENTFILGGHYENLLDAALSLQDKKMISIVTQEEFAQNFLLSKKVFPPTNYFLSKAYDSDDQTFWYNSPNYRIGIEKVGKRISIIDFRDYTQKFSEEFSLLPNSQIHLRVYEKSLIDSATIPSQKTDLMYSDESLNIKQLGDKIILSTEKKEIGVFGQYNFSFTENKNINSSPNKPAFLPIKYLVLIGCSVYLLSCYLIRKNKRKFLYYEILLLIPIVLSIPYLPQGYSNDLTFVFDRKQIPLFSIIRFLPLTPTIKLITVSILPIFLLFIIHIVYLFKKTKSTSILFHVSLLLVSFVYLHFWYFPLDQSTYKEVITISGVIGLVWLAATIILYRKTKSRKIITLFTASTIVTFIIFGFTIVLSRSKHVIVPFELNTLDYISESNRDVIYVSPDIDPIYKAVRPLLLTDISAGENLTNKKWIKSNLIEYYSMISNYKDPVIIVVPRYLGSEISEENIKKYGLIKAFDNFQFALYTKN